MIHDLKPYPEYRESGVPGIGQVPRHWEVRRQSNCVSLLVSNVDKNTVAGEMPVRLCNYIDVYKNPRINKKIPFMRATARPAEIELFRVRLGDVIITKDSESWNDIGVPSLVEYEAEDLICGYHLAVLRPRPGMVLGEFLYRATESQAVMWQYHVAANGVTRYGLSHSSIKNVCIPVPPLAEQAAIVRFLDQVDRRIRRYVRSRRKLLSFLNEQKQAAILQTVVRGFGLGTRLKPSGVEWLGEIPNDWSVQRAKSIFRLRTEKSVPGHGMELLSVYSHIGVRPRRELEERGNKATTTDGYWIVRRGDIIVNKLLAWMGAVGVSEYDGVTSPAYDILMPIQPIVPEYYHYLFRTPLYLQQFKMRSRGIMSMRLRLYFDQLGQIPVPLPPIDRQAEAVDFCKKSTNALDLALRNLDDEISLALEYRASLIADIVKGKIDVRGVAVQLVNEPDEPDEPDSDEQGEDSELIDEGEEIPEGDREDRAIELARTH